MSDWPQLKAVLAAAGITVSGNAPPRSVGGGDIAAAWQLQTEQGPVFLKTGPLEFLDMFAAEADGLRALAEAGALRVPQVMGVGDSGDDAFLALEWLELEPAGREQERRLGRQLARLHRVTGESFGWRRDNLIGTTPQLNDRDPDWLHFYRERRLLVQMQLAESHGFDGELLRQGARLANDLARLFAGYEPQPSLLHGDLWGGNWGSVGGEPVVFDPAVHFGDRECDLAMTRLFGGFGRDFYEAYEAEWPLDAGAGRRLPLYQLYHVLNHLNMFGDAYRSRAMALLAELNDAIG